LIDRRFSLLWLLMFILFWGPVSQAQEMELTILGLSVEGNELTDDNLILLNSGLGVNDQITLIDLQNAMHQLWKLGRFSDLEIAEERTIGNGVFLVIRVHELPLLGTIEISGNKKLKKYKIEEKVEELLWAFHPIPASAPFNIRRSLLELYSEEGYNLAEIEVTVDDTNPSAAVCQIFISEGEHVRIREVIFHGLIELAPEKLQKKMKKTRTRRWWRSGEFDITEYEEDKQAVLDYCRNEGYSDAAILSDSLSYSEDGSDMFIHLNVYEGPRYHFGEITWSGNTLFTDEFLQSQLVFRSGDIFNQEKLDESVMMRVQNLYYDNGYINAYIDYSRQPAADDRLDLNFTIHEGNEFRVAHIIIQGNDKTKEKVIRREMVLYPGDTFNRGKLDRSFRNIMMLNYFSNVVPDVEIAGSDQVDLIMNVTEKGTDNIQMSAGYSGRDGMIGQIGFGMKNFMGNGQQMDFSWNFGYQYRSLSLAFTEPYLWDTPTLAGFRVYDMQRGGAYYSFDFRERGFSVTLGRKLTWPDDYFRISGRYSLEEVMYTNFDEGFDYSRNDLVEDEPQISSVFSLTLSRDTKNRVEYPTRGATVSLTGQLSGGMLGGDEHFQKYTLEYKWYQQTFLKLVSATSVMAGVSDGLRMGQTVPYLDRFYMGGTGLGMGTPLRGYDERQVGPMTDGLPDGGRTMMKLSWELRRSLIESDMTVYLLTFAEGGNVWSRFNSASFGTLRRSAGFGLRMYMPMIGLIGIDFGYGFDYFSAETGLRKGQWYPHFQFGRTF
jgi:outer membrane protein insertion porin family